MNITIDGQAVTAREGQTVLEVCRQLGKDIPTLCYHMALRPYAACRVCLVELVAGGRPGLVPACQYPVGDGLAVLTDSPAVREARRVVLELLLARCPGSEAIRELAHRHGVDTTPYPSDEPDQSCILCGLCVRACEDLIGAAAIGFSQRGIDRQVRAPFDESSEACIGCEACAAVCPTGHVLIVDRGSIRRMATWKTEMALAACESCGKHFATVKQLEFERAKLPPHVPLEQVCPDCRRRRKAEQLKRSSGGTQPAGARPAAPGRK